MDLNFEDYYTLVHPTIAIIVIFPILGLITRLAWQTRQRRLQSSAGVRSSIPPTVGHEHVKLGRWLSASVVGLTLLGLTNSIFSTMVLQQGFGKEPLRYTFVLLMFVVTIAALVLLYRAKSKLWRGVFATLTGMGVILIGCQPEVFRRTNEWYISHYYYGIVVTLLMIFSIATVPDIYKDRKNRWRTFHIVINVIAVAFFITQAFLGVRDLLEIPLGWEEDYLSKCDFVHKTCPK